MPLMTWNGGLLVKPGGLAIHPRCCCGAVPPALCCCPQFTPPAIPPAFLTVNVYEGGTTNLWISFQIPFLNRVLACVVYRKITQDLGSPCFTPLAATFDLVCANNATSPDGFELTVTSSTSGCTIQPVGGASGDPLLVNAGTATCQPMFLEFQSFEIVEQALGSCGTCNGQTFDVEVLD